MKFKTKNFNYLNKNIEVISTKKLKKEDIFHIDDLIYDYVKEITLNEINNSFDRFNSSPTNFPFKIYPLFFYYLFYLYTSLQTLGMLQIAFNLDIPTDFNSLIFFDKQNNQIIKKTPFIIKRKLLTTPILMTLIFNLINVNYDYLEIIFEDKKIKKQNNKALSSIQNSYEFELYGFTMSQKRIFKKELILMHPSLILLEAFSIKDIKDEKLFKDLTNQYKIKFSEVQDHSHL